MSDALRNDAVQCFSIVQLVFTSVGSLTHCKGQIASNVGVFNKKLKLFIGNRIEPVQLKFTLNIKFIYFINKNLLNYSNGYKMHCRYAAVIMFDDSTKAFF